MTEIKVINTKEEFREFLNDVDADYSNFSIGEEVFEIRQDIDFYVLSNTETLERLEVDSTEQVIDLFNF